MDFVAEMSSDAIEDSDHSVRIATPISDDTAEPSQVLDRKSFLERLKSNKPMTDKQMLSLLELFSNGSDDNDEFRIEKVTDNFVNYKRVGLSLAFNIYLFASSINPVQLQGFSVVISQVKNYVASKFTRA